jgi:hypothetical protein
LAADELKVLAYGFGQKGTESGVLRLTKIDKNKAEFKWENKILGLRISNFVTINF